MSEIIHFPNWATSANGQSIQLFASHHFVDLSNNDNSLANESLIFIGGVHGDEPEGVHVAQKLLEWLQKNHKKVKHPWILIPCLNVDGYQKNIRMNGHGVDLNRNYPSQNWSNEFSQKRYYPGPHPGSEPEIQSMVELIETIQPKWIFHFHSWKPCVVLTGDPAQSAAKVLCISSGFELKKDIGYPTPGSLSSYGWHDHKIPVLCLEADDSKPIAESWQRFGQGLINILINDELGLTIPKGQ